ncbi:hypothetical protein Ddye_027211 [Dipteronia dyeriana]|uniref:Terpene synthase metal-binding domain-containing protein n=1 Tax=Dipteronia dyeriana TaxID=168575 RepID=A0AAD9TNV5_9ROSI|nr:hypothetical protein Ddye_027211 [Dipteronia dyeriana]
MNWKIRIMTTMVMTAIYTLSLFDFGCLDNKDTMFHVLAEQITHALNRPIHRNLPRLEARRDINTIDVLPDCMKLIYQPVLDVYNEADEEMSKDGRSFCMRYAIEEVASMADDMLIFGWSINVKVARYEWINRQSAGLKWYALKVKEKLSQDVKSLEFTINR